MSTEQIAAIRDAFTKHFGPNKVFFAEDSSSMILTVEAHRQPIDVYIQFVTNTQNEPVIAFEFCLVSDYNLPLGSAELLYSLHVINYAAAHKHGTSNFILTVRPEVDSEKVDVRMPPAIVALTSRQLNGLLEIDVIGTLELTLKQMVDLQLDVSKLIDIIQADAAAKAELN